MGEYMGSFKLGLSKLTMKLLLVTAATAAIALAAPYNPYSGYNLSPIPSYYYAPYNTISGGVPSTAYATYSNLYSPYNTVSYSNQDPTATNAQLKSSPSYKIQKAAPALAPKSSSPSKTSVPFSDPARLDDFISPGPQYTGNYIGKQLDKVAVLPSATSALAYMKSYFGDGDLCSESGIAYMKSILSGASGAEANAAAEAAYKAAWAKGARLVPGSACEASEGAFKEAYSSGEGSILESARAFVDNWPGLKTGNPCAVSGKAVDDAGYLSAGLSLLPLEILPGPANRLKTPPARMLQRPSLSQPTLPTLPVLNLQRLSSTPPSAPPPAVTTLSVLNLLLPTWMLLPLERVP